ncbi:restriction endonuclease subunit S, partial [Psychrobacter sp. 4Dc]
YNSNLIKQKKNLLPRLMSGKMSVDDLNVHYPPSMQTSSETEEK